MDADLAHGRATLSSSQQGLLAEYMVLVDLARQGYTCTLAPAGARYDVLVDTGTRVIRIQVKSTINQVKGWGHSPRNTYMFRLRSWRSNKNSHYRSDEFEALALVALDCGNIAYMASSFAEQSGIQLKPAGAPNHSRRKNKYTIADFPFKKLLESI